MADVGAGDKYTDDVDKESTSGDNGAAPLKFSWNKYQGKF